jgi:hypothetical protein
VVVVVVVLVKCVAELFMTSTTEGAVQRKARAKERQERKTGWTSDAEGAVWARFVRAKTAAGAKSCSCGVSAERGRRRD